MKKINKLIKQNFHILPHLFTSASLLGGFFAILSSLEGQYEKAAFFIIISGVFDALDGRIARLVNSETHFGTEYDSLTDVVSFGVAPALLLYKWIFQTMGAGGWVFSFMYIICGAIRLARFNVRKKIQKENYFQGLPIPSAACFLASLMFVIEADPWISQHKLLIMIIVTGVLSLFMVSSLNYMSFKRNTIEELKYFCPMVLIILVLTVNTLLPMVVLFSLLSAYVLSGPILTIHQKYGRRKMLKYFSS